MQTLCDILVSAIVRAYSLVDKPSSTFIKLFNLRLTTRILWPDIDYSQSALSGMQVYCLLNATNQSEPFPFCNSKAGKHWFVNAYVPNICPSIFPCCLNRVSINSNTNIDRCKTQIFWSIIWDGGSRPWRIIQREHSFICLKANLTKSMTRINGRKC